MKGKEGSMEEWPGKRNVKEKKEGRRGGANDD